jgi:acetyl-CoA C-acetyltransferase
MSAGANNTWQGAEVVGVGRSGLTPVDPRSIPEMVLEATQRALEDAGVGLADVQSVVSASVDLFDGLTASNLALTEVTGAVMKPETRIAGDGLGALIHGACQIAAGAYDLVLVVAHCKPSMSDWQALTSWSLDPIYQQPLGLTWRAWAGLQARECVQRDLGTPQRWAEIVVRRRRDAGLPAGSPEEVLASPVVASPLREAMRAPLADAACALVLQPGRAGRGVRLRSVGHDLAAHSPRDLGEWTGLRRALQRARSLGGEAPFDLLEPSCVYPHEEQLFLQAIGGRGKAELSPTGGLFAGAAPVVSGLSRAAAAVTWLRAHGGRALAHGTWGPAGQAQAVAILEAE